MPNVPPPNNNITPNIAANTSASIQKPTNAGSDAGFARSDELLKMLQDLARQNNLEDPKDLSEEQILNSLPPELAEQFKKNSGGNASGKKGYNFGGAHNANSKSISSPKNFRDFGETDNVLKERIAQAAREGKAFYDNYFASADFSENMRRAVFAWWFQNSQRGGNGIYNTSNIHPEAVYQMAFGGHIFSPRGPLDLVSR